MAEEITSSLSEMDADLAKWSGIGSATEFTGSPPYLGVVVADDLRRTEQVDAKNAWKWQFDVLDVRSRTGFVHRNTVTISTDKRSKCSMIVKSIGAIMGRAFDFRVVAHLIPDTNGNKKDKSDLIGMVAWFQQDDESLKFGTTTYAFTKAVKKATPEEVTEGLAALSTYVPRDFSAPRETDTDTAPFEWTADRISLATDVLIGKAPGSPTIFSAVRKQVTGDDPLRSAINGGSAGEYLVANGQLALDENGSYVRV